MKAVKSDKLSKQEAKDFQTKWKEHKKNYIKDHTIEEMVYENGSALALLFKEFERLNTNLMTIIKQETDGKKEE